MFGAADAGAAVLPELMQLGDVMKMRAKQERDGYELRKLERDETSDIDEADEFQSFSDRLLSAKDGTPAERAQAAQDWLAENPAAAGNSMISDAIKGHANAASATSAYRKDELDRKKSESDERDLLFSESTRPEREEVSRLASKNALTRAKSEDAAFKSQLEGGAFNDMNKLGEMIGRSRGLDAGSQESLYVLGSRFQGDANKGMLQGVVNMIHGFSKASDLEESYRSELSNYDGIIKGLEKNGVKLDPSMPAADLAVGFDKARKLVGTNPNAIKNLDALQSSMSVANATMGEIGKMREALMADLPKIEALSSKPETMDQAKEMMLKWNLRASKFTGLQDAEIERRTRQIETQERGLKLKKLVGEIAGAESNAKLAEGRAKLANTALELRQQQAQLGRDEFEFRIVDSLLESGKYTPKTNEPKEVNEKKAALDAAVKSIYDVIDYKPQFGGTNDVNLK